MDGIQLRDIERFARWSFVELASVGTLCVAHINGDPGSIVGYCSVVRVRDNRYRCREIGIARRFLRRLHNIVEQMILSAVMACADEAKHLAEVVADIPLAFLQATQQKALMQSGTTFDDEGFLFIRLKKRG